MPAETGVLATQHGVGGDVIRGGPGSDIGADAGDTVVSVEVQGAVCFADRSSSTAGGIRPTLPGDLEAGTRDA